NYTYQFTFVDGNGHESRRSADVSVTLAGGQNQVTLMNIPTGPAGTTARRIYRTGAATTPVVVATLTDNVTTNHTDKANELSPTPGAGGALSQGNYVYDITFVGAGGAETLATDDIFVTVAAGQNQIALNNIPLGPAGTTARRI